MYTVVVVDMDISESLNLVDENILNCAVAIKQGIVLLHQHTSHK
jgi:hypothetical protein